MEPAGASPCPKCGYVRTPADRVPAWQCPSCGVAVDKFRALRDEARALGLHAERLDTTEPVAGTSAAPLEVPSVPRRLLSAVPDTLTASLYLWCWLAPTAWYPKLASELGLALLMQFFIFHFTALAGHFILAAQGLLARLIVTLVALAFYLPVGGAFAYAYGGRGAMFIVCWLLLSQVGAGLWASGSEASRQRQLLAWGNAGACYVLGCIAALLLPLPQLGLAARGSYPWDSFWRLPPWEVMAWGVFCFGGLALTHLFPPRLTTRS